MTRILCFGLGFSARTLARRWLDRGWQVSGTSRSSAGADRLSAMGVDGLVFDGVTVSEQVQNRIATATHIVVSVPPGDGPDPVLAATRASLAAAPTLQWIGYLSTIGVYGDHEGRWIDETTAPTPQQPRSRHRLAAEQAWAEVAGEIGCALHIFRLAGIYGPGRSPIDQLRAGTARCIVKPGQVFNRIHVEDIANVVDAAMATPDTTEMVFNVTDDEPAPPQDVVDYAASLLGMTPPPEQPFETSGLSEMGRSFYSENKRVSNARIKAVLGVTLAYPTYRESLRALAGRPSA